jgi:hypothetical protein
MEGKTKTGGYEPPDFSYGTTPPPKDLLNYRDMDNEMFFWARTDNGWRSIVVLLGLLGLCFALASLVSLLRLG